MSISWVHRANICRPTIWQKNRRRIAIIPCVPPKRPPFYLLNNSVKNWPILIIIFGMLNPGKIWHEHLTDLSTSPVRCSHFPWEFQKSHFLTLLFIYFRLFTLAQMKTSSNCCSAAVAVYLLLLSASYSLHSPRCRLEQREILILN